MHAFARLYEELDQSNKTNDKVAALVRFFSTAEEGDKIWALALLSGRRPRRHVSGAELRFWVSEETSVPLWLVEESYHVVGDLAETVSLLLPPAQATQERSLAQTMEELAALAKAPEVERRAWVTDTWQSLTQPERLVFTKLITGGFRVGVSENLVLRALAEVTGQTTALLAHRIIGNWNPAETDFAQLVLRETVGDDHSRPYPFFLAYPVEAPADLGDPADWQAEWKWDGIRSQLIRRGGASYLWSRGEELITEKFPELTALGTLLPDGTVVDGEILPLVDGQIAPFGVLQTRIGRKNLTAKILKEVPVAVYAYDLLEFASADIRTRPLAERRSLLEKLVADTADTRLHFSPAVPFTSWEELAETRLSAREQRAEGFMLKRLSSPYQVGRKRGDWWKWKVDPLSIDAVLIYAQRGSGRRADLFTDYTFAVWDGDKLVPFAKAYSGLTDAEIAQVDRFIKANIVDKFGPVRTVTPKLVFEIGFEGIQASTRHKSGVAVRFPRILRWRLDKKVEEADTLEALKGLL